MDLDRADERGPRAESWVRVVSLMVLSIALVVTLGVFAVIPLFLLAQPCPLAMQPCDDVSGPVAALLMIGVPTLAVLVGIVGGSVQLARRRRAIRWPGIACIVAVGSWLAGVAVALIAAS